MRAVSESNDLFSLRRKNSFAMAMLRGVFLAEIAAAVAAPARFKPAAEFAPLMVHFSIYV